MRRPNRRLSELDRQPGGGGQTVGAIAALQVAATWGGSGFDPLGHLGGSLDINNNRFERFTISKPPTLPEGLSRECALIERAQARVRKSY